MIEGETYNYIECKDNIIFTIDTIEKSSYKHIEYKDNVVILTHYLSEEYENEIDNKSYEEYKNETIQSYKLAEQLNYCKIIDIDITEESITIEMENYKILYYELNNYMGKKPFIKKFCKLLNEMYINNIMHLDLAPRNIGIDKNGDFKLIDLNDLYTVSNKQDFINLLHYSKFEFDRVGLGNKYYKACEMFQSNS